MLEGLRGLVDLSRVDTELGVCEREKASLPGKRAACSERRAASEARLTAVQAMPAEIEQAQRRCEVDAKDREALLGKLEAQQHQVKTNEAYTALLREMDVARQAISEAETGILEALEALDRAHGEAREVEREVKGLSTGIETEERSLDEREQELDRKIEALCAERTQLISNVDRKILARYDRVASRRSPAVAVVSSEMCTGCRVGIPPQSYIEVLRAEDLVICGQCARILIHETQLA